MAVGLGRALGRRGMVEEILPGRPAGAQIASRRRRERVRVVPEGRGPVDLHGREWRVRGEVAGIVENDWRRRPTAEGSGRVTASELGRYWEREVGSTTASICREQRPRTTWEHQ